MTTTRPKYTRHQVPRGTRPDAQRHDRLYLLKNVSTLRATYQIRLVLHMAMQSGKKLALRIPARCKIAPDLAELQREYSKVFLIERT